MRSISTEASAKILPNFTGLIERTVIETMLEGGCFTSSGDDPAINLSWKESQPAISPDK
jgi:hypothetical protein